MSYQKSPEIEIEPHNMEAEQGLLGALLYDNRAYDRIADKLKPDEFYFAQHARIYAAIIESIEAGRQASPVTLKDRFENDPDLQNVGGARYLAELLASVVSVFNAEDYAVTIRGMHRRRAIIRLAAEMRDIASRDCRDAEEILADAERALTALSDEKQGDIAPVSSAVTDARKWMDDVKSGRLVQFKTGYKELDYKSGGLFGKTLYIIAGRPGMGKTALAVNIADNIGKEKPVLFLSLEMPASELGMRLIAARTGISVSAQREVHGLSSADWENIDAAEKDIAALNLSIFDTPGISLSGIKSSARRFWRKHGPFVLIIDYLTLIKMDRGIANRVHQIEEITVGLKRLAKELDIPVILLSQLNRGLESRDDKKPNLGDLRDSGSIEQDADVVMFTYREEYYLSRSEPVRKSGQSETKYAEAYADWEAQLKRSRGGAEIIIAKNRQGRTGIVPMRFDGDRQRFYS